VPVRRQGRHEIEQIALRERTGGVWHGYLPDAGLDWLYGYRVSWASMSRNKAIVLIAHKLLLDPYAKAFVGQMHWSDAQFAYRMGGQREDFSFNTRNSAPGMPKCQVVDTAFVWGDDRPPRIPWHHTLIYELHVRGFTMRHPDIAA
jgi:isoamylase